MMHNNIKSAVCSSNRELFDCNEKQFIGSVFNRLSRDTAPTARVLTYLILQGSYNPSSNKCNKQLPKDYKMLTLHLLDQKNLLFFDNM